MYFYEFDVKKFIFLVEDNILIMRILIIDFVVGLKDFEILYGMLGYLCIFIEWEYDRELFNIVFEGCEL